jgi:hypothetical protein
LLAAKFDDARVLRAFFLLFYDRSPRLLLVLRPRDINRTLRCDFKCGATLPESKGPRVAS